MLRCMNGRMAASLERATCAPANHHFVLDPTLRSSGRLLANEGAASIAREVASAWRRSGRIVNGGGHSTDSSSAHWESNANEIADTAVRRSRRDRPSRSIPDSFAHDFSHVRLHTGTIAERSAEALGARAYTFGNDIVFGRAQYAPADPAGRWLIAHELAHVAQQRAMSPQGARVVQRVGFFQTIARFFGGGTFSDDELREYLKYLDTNQKIEDHYDSDNKAREIVKRWKAGKVGFTVLIIPIRILLIKEMAAGYLSDADQGGILDLLTESIPAERARILPAVGIDQLKVRFDGDRRKKLDALLDTQDIEAIGLADEWSVPETRKIVERHGDGGIIAQILAAGFKIFRFVTAFDKWRYDDGRVEENELTGLLGNTDRTAVPRRIRLRKSLKNEEAASTLFHEGQHAILPPATTQPEYLEGETTARVGEEGFRWRHGMPPDDPSYRTAAGKPDVAAIRADVTGSPHYNPTGRQRIGRRYVGETDTIGWT